MEGACITVAPLRNKEELRDKGISKNAFLLAFASKHRLRIKHTTLNLCDSTMLCVSLAAMLRVGPTFRHRSQGNSIRTPTAN